MFSKVDWTGRGFEQLQYVLLSSLSGSKIQRMRLDEKIRRSNTSVDGLTPAVLHLESESTHSEPDKETKQIACPQLASHANGIMLEM